MTRKHTIYLLVRQYGIYFKNSSTDPYVKKNIMLELKKYGK